MNTAKETKLPILSIKSISFYTPIAEPTIEFDTDEYFIFDTPTDPNAESLTGHFTSVFSEQDGLLDERAFSFTNVLISVDITCMVDRKVGMSFFPTSKLRLLHLTDTNGTKVGYGTEHFLEIDAFVKESSIKSFDFILSCSTRN